MSEVNVLIRGVDAELNARIDAAAKEAKMSKQELLLAHLMRTFPAPAVVVGWVELDWVNDCRCPQCGRESEGLLVGVLPDGGWTTPHCSSCAAALNTREGM